MFLFLDIHKDWGIINVIPLSVYDVQRVQYHEQGNPYLVQFCVGGDKKNFLENYEIIHFRMYTDSNFLPYGRSMLQGARQV